MTGAGEAEQPQLIVTFAPAVRFAPFAEKVRFGAADGVAVSEERKGHVQSRGMLNEKVGRTLERGRMKMRRCGMRKYENLYFLCACTVQLVLLLNKHNGASRSAPASAEK